MPLEPVTAPWPTKIVQVTSKTGTRSFRFFDTEPDRLAVTAVGSRTSYPQYVLTQPVTSILDLGANSGIFTVTRAMQYPDARIVAVEPDPHVFKLLIENTQDLPNVSRWQGAVVGDDDPEQLYIRERCCCTVMSFVTDKPAEENSPDRTFPISTLPASQFWDDVLKEPPSILKMDIEASEGAVLQSLGRERLAKVGVIYLEYHGAFPRLLADQMLAPSHLLVAARIITPDQGELTFIRPDWMPQKA